MEITETQCGNFKNFPHDFLEKIPSKYYFTKELYYKLISQNFFEVGVNFRNFHHHTVEKREILSHCTHQYFFRQINSLVTYLVKPLRSRNFCQKGVREREFP